MRQNPFKRDINARINESSGFQTSSHNIKRLNLDAALKNGFHNDSRSQSQRNSPGYSARDAREAR